MNTEIESIRSKVAREIDINREGMFHNLVKLSELASRPMPTSCQSIEGAMQVRMRELESVINNQHARLRNVGALKFVLRQIDRLEKQASQPKAQP